ncbi:MAG TPA: 2-oxoglutarate and iron-dependent oxygenase domain-containing protein [Stellaceae bacterium]|nr:2-oxoglutarate and iron-dependent oxygenase domain-containing protein [Stellaceae bacterium]
MATTQTAATAINTISDGAIDAFSDFDNRYLRQGIARNDLVSLPVIDISPFVQGGSEAAREAVAQQIRQASIDIGFFYAKGHGFSAAELQAMLDWGLRFFHLPSAEKNKLFWKKDPGRGYVPPGGLNPDANKDKAPDLKERLYFAREHAMSEAEHRGAFPQGPHQWPEEAALPDFRRFVTETQYKSVALIQRLGFAIARSLGLDEAYFERENGRFGSTMVYNYYPPLDRATLERTQWSFSPHTDYGSFTIVVQDGNGGLQVRNASGQWIDVTPVPGTVIVNIGDLIALATNDLYTSNLHRVANFSGNERLSVTFFVGPPATAEISCLPTCRGPDNPARYPTVNAEDYTQALIEQYHRTGRPGIAVTTASRFKKQ